MTKGKKKPDAPGDGEDDAIAGEAGAGFVVLTHASNGGPVILDPGTVSFIHNGRGSIPHPTKKATPGVEQEMVIGTVTFIGTVAGVLQVRESVEFAAEQLGVLPPEPAEPDAAAAGSE